MELGLADKVVLVTGSGKGIGRQTILSFAQEQAKVVVNDIDQASAEKVAEEARKIGVDSMACLADVTNPDDVKRMVYEVISKFGRIDVLVNNAFTWDRKRFTDSRREEWEPPLKVCLYGTLHCCHSVVTSMVAQKSGKIISMVSEAGRIGEATSPIYAASKAAIIAFSKSLAKEVGHSNINVNCVSAAAVNTERRIREHQAEWEVATNDEKEKIKIRNKKQLSLYPLGRIGMPADIAGMLVFLASERASYITGQVFGVNGGYTMIG